MNTQKDKTFMTNSSDSKLSKRDKWKVVMVLLALTVVLGAGFSWFLYSKQSEMVDGNQGDSTIIPELQTAVDSLLGAELTEINGLQGQVIVMEVQTGQILAMVGLERYFEGKYKPCQNFAYQQELGSMMKVASLLVALESGKSSLSDIVDVGDGVWIVDSGKLMKDHNWRRGGYGEITLERALEVSSNIGISKTIWKIFKGHEQDYFNMLDSMSFGQPSSIDGIDGLCPTALQSPKDSDWVNEHVLWSSIGYNQKIAPIQMLTFYNAIANNGRMVKPTLKLGKAEVINQQIASKENIAIMQTALNHVVSHGMGKKAGSPLLKVAGKTGTSQVGEYSLGVVSSVMEYQLGFCGYFPADKPKYSMIVSMNKLGLPASGGGMAGVVFHNVLEWMIIQGLLPLATIDEATNDTAKITPNNIHAITDALSK